MFTYYQLNLVNVQFLRSIPFCGVFGSIAGFHRRFPFDVDAGPHSKYSPRHGGAQTLSSRQPFLASEYLSSTLSHSCVISPLFHTESDGEPRELNRKCDGRMRIGRCGLDVAGILQRIHRSVERRSGYPERNPRSHDQITPAHFFLASRLIFIN
jgi:hypothetical protein